MDIFHIRMHVRHAHNIQSISMKNVSVILIINGTIVNLNVSQASQLVPLDQNGIRKNLNANVLIQANIWSTDSVENAQLMKPGTDKNVSVFQIITKSTESAELATQTQSIMEETVFVITDILETLINALLAILAVESVKGPMPTNA